jgi:endonuclease/exonuclease/phosphatase family metal-dependent hydrolase
MNRLFKTIGFSAVCGAFLSIAANAQYPAQVKIMTYNINAQGHSSGSYDDIATVIKAIEPDIAGLQKLDSVNTRNSLYVLKWLSENTAMPSFEYQSALQNYLSGSYGVGFLMNQPAVSTRHLWIKRTASEEDRGVLEIGITMGGKPARIIVTHLAHEGKDYRTSQINKILPWIDSVSATDPVIIMADFNADSTETSMQLFTKAGYEYVRGKNGVRLDTTTNGIIHILYRPINAWRVVDAANPVYAASNRNPVWATMELLGGTPVRKFDITETHKSISSIKVQNNIVRYELARPAVVSIALYNAAGEKISVIMKEQNLTAGSYSLKVQDKVIKNGMYFVNATIDGKKTICKMFNAE